MEENNEIVKNLAGEEIQVDTVPSTGVSQQMMTKDRFLSMLQAMATKPANEARRADNKVRKERKANKLAKAHRKLSRLGRKSKTRKVR